MNAGTQLLIQAGSAEVLLDDARRLAQRAQNAGAAVRLEEWPHMFHVWLQLSATIARSAHRFARCCGVFARALRMNAGTQRSGGGSAITTILLP